MKKNNNEISQKHKENSSPEKMEIKLINATKIVGIRYKTIAHFLANPQTKKLIKAMDEAKILSSKNKEAIITEQEIMDNSVAENGDIYMSEDLAFAYVMWMNPRFNVYILKAVREGFFYEPDDSLRNMLTYSHCVSNISELEKKCISMLKVTANYYASNARPR